MHTWENWKFPSIALFFMKVENKWSDLTSKEFTKLKKTVLPSPQFSYNITTKMLTSIRAADLTQISPFVCTHLFVCGWVCVYFSVVLSHVSLHIHHRSQDTEQVPPHEDASWCPWETWHLPPAPPSPQPPAPNPRQGLLRSPSLSLSFQEYHKGTHPGCYLWRSPSLTKQML